MDHENGPLVTAVIPVYNHEKYVAESIRSILQQTYRNIELIVINDGSRDRSHERILPLIPECRERFVRFEYINRENRGLSATLDQALGMAKGKYISGLASDDVALPEKIRLLVEALESKDDSYAAAFGDALFIDKEGRPLFQDEHDSLSADSRGRPQARFLDFYTSDRKFDTKGPEFGTYKTLLHGNYLPAMSSLIRTDELREAGDWAKGNILEDWEMWLKLSKKYKFAFVDEAVALYRWHPFNTQKAAPEKFGSSCFKLIEGEKGFCISNNLLTEWRQSHESALERFFFNREISPIKRLAHLKPSDVPTVTLIAMKLTIRKLARPFSGRG